MNTNPIVLALDADLTPINFRRRGLVWNRHIGGIIEVIDLQVSKSRDLVTMNAGVLDPTVYKTVWDEEPPEFVKEPACTVRARIAELLDQRDRWWQLGDDKDIGEILDVIAGVALPFLQRMRSRGEMVSWLDRAEVAKRRQPAEILGLAVLKDLIGRHSEACELIANQQKRAMGAWNGRYDEVARRLRCVPGGALSVF